MSDGPKFISWVSRQSVPHPVAGSETLGVCSPRPDRIAAFAAREELTWPDRRVTRMHREQRRPQGAGACFLVLMDPSSDSTTEGRSAYTFRTGGANHHCGLTTSQALRRPVRKFRRPATLKGMGTEGMGTEGMDR